MSLPPLPASIADPCPPAPPLAGASLADLVAGDAALARLYALCRARHAAAVRAYESARGGGE